MYSQRIFWGLIEWWWTTRQEDIIRISQQRSQQGIVLRGQTTFCYYMWWQKNGKRWSGHARLHAKVAMDEGLLNVWVSQSIGQSQLEINIATFSTQNLREQGCKSYVASYQVNEELVILQIFPHELRQWRSFAEVFFRGWFPIYSNCDLYIPSDCWEILKLF